MIALKISRIGIASVFVCIFCAVSTAQNSIQPVSWSIALKPGTSVGPGSHLTLDVAAHIEDGWHVYAFHQADGGPTPLRITADPTGIVQLAGLPSGSLPVKKHDSSFDLTTETFSGQVELHVPVVAKASTSVGGDAIGLNIRFQACNDHVCLPPRTVHLIVSTKS
jgi:hypothetical protein